LKVSTLKNLLVLLAVFCAGSVLAQQVVKVGSNGFTTRFNPIVATVYKEIGLTPQFINLPAERILKSLEHGEIDADLGRVAGGTAGYRNMVETNESLFELYLYAVVTQDFGGDEITIANLKTHRVGLVRGAKLAEGTVAKLGIEASVANTPQQLFQMAVAGRVDVVLLTSAFPLKSFPECAASMRQQAKPLAVAKAVHVMGAKLAATHACKGDATVRAMKADGRWTKLMAGL